MWADMSSATRLTRATNPCYRWTHMLWHGRAWSVFGSSLVVVLFLGTLGFAAVATLFAFVTVRLRTRQVMLPLLVLPLLIPLLIAAVKATEAVLGDGLAGAGEAIGVLVSFDVIFVTAGALLFPAIVRD